MILYDCVEVFNDIFMIQIFDEIDFLLNRFDLFLADGHFLHGHDDAIIQINSFVD